MDNIGCIIRWRSSPPGTRSIFFDVWWIWNVSILRAMRRFRSLSWSLSIAMDLFFRYGVHMKRDYSSGYASVPTGVLKFCNWDGSNFFDVGWIWNVSILRAMRRFQQLCWSFSIAIIVDVACRCNVSIVRVMRQCQYCWIRIAGFTSDIRSRVKVLKMESVVFECFSNVFDC